MLPLRMLGLLMLLFSLCDADSTCPTDDNPLSLDPPEVLGQYGESVLVNCSSTNEDHDYMYWSVGNTDSPKEYDNSYIVQSVALSDWSVTAECKIKLEDTECSKELEITVYKNPDDVIVFPTTHAVAVEGMQYELQCDIINVAPVQNLTVRWYKDNQTIKIDSFTNTTKTPVTESSTLAINISRGEHRAQFRCEAQLDFGAYGPQLPVLSETHTVSVNYAPELKNQTEDVYVNEGNDVTLRCEAEGRPAPLFHWTRDGVVISESTNNLNVTQVNTSATYNCTAANLLGNMTKQFHVHVVKTIMAAAPAAPAAITTPMPSTPRDCPIVLTPAEIVVRFGDPASVNCSTSAADAFGMGWEATDGGTGFHSPPYVLWTVEKLENWNISTRCYITLQDNTQCTVLPTITLYKTPDIVSVSALDQGPMVEGTEFTLKCDIINVAPVQKLKLKWYRGNETVHTQTFNDSSEAPVNVSSTLRVTAGRDYNGALFRCEAELHLGPNGPELVPTVTSPPYTAVVNYKPLIQDCPSRHAGVEHKFSMDMLSCQADGNPPPTLQWYYEGELINASEPLTRTQSGEYTAEVVNDFGGSNTSVDITIEYGPSFTCGDRYEVEENGKLQCEPEGIPTPIITWWKDGKDMASPHLTKHDSGKYSLQATNKHGTANHTLHLNVLYAPVFKEGNYKDKTEVTLGENVTFDCSAEGNPPPVIHWNYTSAGNVRETTRGLQRSITITGATSTNADVFICVAKNRVGTVTRSVTLIMKDKTSAFPLTVIWWLLIVLIVVLMLVFMIVVHNRRKRHGQYSFVPDSSERPIPMTTQSNGVQA